VQYDDADADADADRNGETPPVGERRLLLQLLRLGEGLEEEEEEEEVLEEEDLTALSI
jgi:hypothetical protein